MKPPLTRMIERALREELSGEVLAAALSAFEAPSTKLRSVVYIVGPYAEAYEARLRETLSKLNRPVVCIPSVTGTGVAYYTVNETKPQWELVSAQGFIRVTSERLNHFRDEYPREFHLSPPRFVVTTKQVHAWNGGNEYLCGTASGEDRLLPVATAVTGLCPDCARALDKLEVQG